MKLFVVLFALLGLAFARPQIQFPGKDKDKVLMSLIDVMQI